MSYLPRNQENGSEFEQVHINMSGFFSVVKEVLGLN